MTREDIKDMIAKVYGVVWTNEAQLKDLERFATLVASAEREACANVAEQVGQHKNQHGIAAAIRARP